MAKKENTNTNPSFVIEFGMHPEPWQADILSKQMEYLRHLYNRANSILLREYKKMIATPEFKEAVESKKKKNIAEVVKNYKFVVDMGVFVQEVTFSEFGFKGLVRRFGKLLIDDNSIYSDKGINTTMLGIVSNRLWSAYDKLLFDKKCTMTHFKSIGMFNSLPFGFSSGNLIGIQNIDFKNNVIVIRRKKQTDISIHFEGIKTHYDNLALNGGDVTIKQLTIVRRTIRGKERYFVQFTINGTAPSKGRCIGTGTVGLDMGPHSLKYVADDTIDYINLADSSNEDFAEYKRLQRKLDRSRRATNPHMYDEQGRSIKGTKQTVKSNRYKKTEAKLNDMKRQAAARRKIAQNIAANQVLVHGNHIVVEDNPFKGWQKRRSGKAFNKKGRQLSKKRFGRSILKGAPAQFVTILENKVNASSGWMYKASCKNAASKFDIFTKEVDNDIKLSDRRVTMSDGIEHDRDYNAAFKLKHLKPFSKEQKDYDYIAMYRDYPKFCEMEKTRESSLKQ